MSDSEIQNNEDIEFIDFIGFIFRNLKTISIITIISMVIVLSISILSLKLPPEVNFLPNKYSPKSLVILNSAASGGMLDSLMGNSGMGALAGLAGLPGGESGPTEADLAIRLAKTNSFITKLDETFNLSEIYKTNTKKNPKTSLAIIINKNLKIEQDENSGLLEISYTDTDKFLATKIANKATVLLENEFSKIDSIRNKNQFNLARENKIKIETEMERIAKETILFQKKHNLIDVDTVFEQIMKQMSTLQTSLLNKEVEIENYKMISSIKDPAYKRLVNEKLAIMNAISKLESGHSGKFPPVDKLPELALELQELKSDMAIQQAVYKTIVQQYEALKLTEGGSGPTFQVLEMAVVPEIKSEPSRAKICIIFSILGFIISLIIVFAKEFWQNVKRNPTIINKLKGVKSWKSSF